MINRTHERPEGCSPTDKHLLRKVPSKWRCCSLQERMNDLRVRPASGGGNWYGNAIEHRRTRRGDRVRAVFRSEVVAVPELANA